MPESLKDRMKGSKSLFWILFYIAVLIILGQIFYIVAKESHLEVPSHDIILNPIEYQDEAIPSVMGKIWNRIGEQPFNLIATFIFLCAIVHTFLSHQFSVLAHKLEDRNRERGKEVQTFTTEILHFLGEVEVIFGLWVIPLMVSMSLYYDWSTALNYLNTRNYTEPTFVIVIMALAATRPILRLSEESVRNLARIGGGSVTAWWFSILTIGPFLGSIITEPGAMTICAILLSKQFYSLKPSNRLAYATLGLLFTNVSVGGVFTNFAAPAVLMVSRSWEWSSYFMMYTFGFKAIFAVIGSNILYYYLFRKDFREMEAYSKKNPLKEVEEEPIPAWITITHLVFLAWTVIHSHYPVIFVGSFMLFLGFRQATRIHQLELNMKIPLLVGYFLAGIIVHGGLQGWWIDPVISEAKPWVLYAASVFLTAFNDNAGITYLATLVPNFSDILKYSVVAGAVAGGGLTVIANAPNPAGHAILGKHFKDGISHVGLFVAALIPMFVVTVGFWFARVFNLI